MHFITLFSGSVYSHLLDDEPDVSAGSRHADVCDVLRDANPMQMNGICNARHC